MAIFGDGRDFSRLFERAPQRERERQRAFDAELSKAGGTALEIGQALLAQLATVPTTLLAAEGAEYERILGIYGEQHPRALEIKARTLELERAEKARAAGRTRAARALASLRLPGAAFHGFVADADGAPLPGLSVRLVKAKQSLEATTEADGYFRLTLPTAAGEPSPATVVIARRGATVYEDPIALQIDQGTAYREYLIDERAPRARRPAAGVRPAAKPRERKSPGKVEKGRARTRRGAKR